MADEIKLTDDEVRAVAEAIKNGQAIVCYAKCWECQFAQCFDPPQVHTWMDDEDAAHAGVTLPVDPTQPGKLCGCSCAKVPAQDPH